MIKRPSKGPAPPKELFALGTKAKTDVEIKAVLGLKKSGNAGTAAGISNNMTGISLKRERDQSTGGGSSLQVTKRPRFGSGTMQPGRPSDMQMHVFEDIAIDVEGTKLVESVMSSLNDMERIEGLLCGAVKNLKLHKIKPDAAMYLAIMFLAKSKPELFQSEVVIEAFCSLLKKEINNSKTKTNSLVSILACNVLAMVMQEEPSWPDSFVRVYLDDSIGDRVWVDRIECRNFVENVITAFGTKLPDNIFQVEPTPTSGKETEEIVNTLIEEVATGPVMDRYTNQMATIEQYAKDIMKDQSRFRTHVDGPLKNLLRTLTFMCGVCEVRIALGQKLDIWLHLPKLLKAPQDLLMSLCMNINLKKYQQDLEVINNICKIRFKNKQLSLYFNSCLRELLAQNSENIPLLLQNLVGHEINTRNPNNMSFINVIIQHSGEHAVKLLAEIMLENLILKDDLKATRVFLREVIKCSRVDFKFGAFIYSMLQDKSMKLRDLEPAAKERYVLSVIDIVSMTMIYSINNSVKETSSLPRADAKDMEVLREFQNQISNFQRDAVWWLHSVVVKNTQIKSSDYMLCLKKVLFIEKPEIYSKIDNWPPESERGPMLKLVSEVPLQEDMLLCIVLMGHNKELHLNIHELMDLLEIIIRRAASIYTDGFPVLKVDNTDFMGALLNLCAYTPPETYVFPKGYKPPSLAITSLYWKAWQILLIISAFNPTSIGLKAWKSYPTLKCLIEIAMTNNFCFPPVTMAPDGTMAEEIKLQERQMAEYFKQQTLEFECHMANEIITESTSRLLPQLCRMELEGFMLEPPQSVLDSLRLLNQSLSLGKLLCQSREPADFLLNIIQRQGTSQSMPWLKDLIESDDSSLEVLPVQCLCEFLLHDIHNDQETTDGDIENKQKKNLKQEQLVMRLQNIVRTSSSEQKVLELINQTFSYFFERLSFNQGYIRRQATKCLALILGRLNLEGDEGLRAKSDCSEILSNYQWLFEELPSLSHFETIKMQIFLYLRAACQVETNYVAVSAYLVFLSRHSKNLVLQELDDLVLDVAQLILERVLLVSCLLPYDCDDEGSNDPCMNLVLSSLIDLFYCHLSKARQPRNDTYSWSNNQYQILLHWNSGQSAKMNILIVHATVITLAFGPPEGESCFDELMDVWFPQNEQQPTAYLIDTSEEALLIPDWLKLRMIRSNVPRLIDASFADAEVPQLLLFIQSFGISVHSMNKLLHHLDMSIENSQSEVMRLVLDKNYMAELIEVQHMRGAEGGQRFYSMLTGGQKQLKCKSDSCAMEMSPIRNFASKLREPRKQEEPDIMELLTKVFLDCDASKAEKSNALRSLQKATRKLPGLMSFVDSCNKMIKSTNGAHFIESLFKSDGYSCTLFRAILSDCQIQDAEEMCSAILSKSKNRTSLFYHLLNEHVGNSERAQGPKLEVKEEHEQAVKQEMTEEMAVKTLESAIGQPSKMEEVVISVLIPFIKQVDSSSSVLKILYELYDTTCNRLLSGLILDCLELFHPQIVQNDLLEQILEIVFKRENSAKPEMVEVIAPSSPMCRDEFEIEGMDEGVHGPDVESFSFQGEYLLCLLLHRSGWSNIIQVINHLLPKFSPNIPDRYDYSAVLDFVEACFHVPSLWQGRDKKVSKHQPAEDILSLNVNQVRCLVTMTVREQSKRQIMRLPMDDDKITCRLNLIETCCSGKLRKLTSAVNVLFTLQRTDENEIVSVLLWGMYLRTPQVFLKIQQAILLTEHSFERLFSEASHMDIATQRMITCLLDVSLAPSRQDEDRLLHATMVSRKLASQHPLIFLRELPLVASFLEGHAQFLSTEMRGRNVPLVITNLLAIIHLLQPYIFHPIHSQALHSIIDSFCQIVSVYGFSTRYPNGLVKFIEIVFNYFHHSSSQAFTCLKKHLPLFRKLDKHHDEFLLLQRLLLRLSCFDEVKRKTPDRFSVLSDERNSKSVNRTNILQEEQFSFKFGVLKCLPFSLAVKTIPAYDNSRFLTLSQKTNRMYVQSTAELIDGLKELDDISKNMVDILEEFIDNIEKLMLDSNNDCREIGYALMMRLLRYNPRCGKVFVKSMKKCFQSGNILIVQSSLDALKEFTVLTQEHAVELILSAFKAGLAWSLDATPYINETLQILNLRLTSH